MTAQEIINARNAAARRLNRESAFEGWAETLGGFFTGALCAVFGAVFIVGFFAMLWALGAVLAAPVSVGTMLLVVFLVRGGR